MFVALVEVCTTATAGEDVIADARVARVAATLRALWMRGEFLLERRWAAEVERAQMRTFSLFN